MVSSRGDGAVSGDAARRAAEAELSRREYHHDDSDFLTRALHWIGDRLDDLFSSGGGSHALLIGLAVLVVVAVVLAIRAGLTPGGARRGTASGASPDLLAGVSAQDHLRVAARCAAEGRRAEALREYLRAAVARIEERGVLPPRPGRTGAATAREAGPLLPGAAADLQTATRAFDEVWFGGRAASDSDVATARAAAEAVGSARIVTTAAPGELVFPR